MLLLDGVMVTLALRLGGLKAPVWQIVACGAGSARRRRGCARDCREGCAPLLWLPIADGHDGGTRAGRADQAASRGGAAARARPACSAARFRRFPARLASKATGLLLGSGWRFRC
ncbi:MAG: hypothetical protein ACLUHE_03330 [Christensenellales bacterium]